MKNILLSLFVIVLFQSCQKSENKKVSPTHDIAPEQAPLPPQQPATQPPTLTNVSPNQSSDQKATLSYLSEENLILTKANFEPWKLNSLQKVNLKKDESIIRKFHYSADQSILLQFKDSFESFKNKNCSKNIDSKVTFEVIVNTNKNSYAHNEIPDIKLEANQSLVLEVKIENLGQCSFLDYNFGVMASEINVTPTPTRNENSMIIQPKQQENEPQTDVVAPQKKLTYIEIAKFNSGSEGVQTDFSNFVMSFDRNPTKKDDPTNAYKELRSYHFTLGQNLIDFKCEQSHFITIGDIWEAQCQVGFDFNADPSIMKISSKKFQNQTVVSIDILDKDILTRLSQYRTGLLGAGITSSEEVELTDSEGKKTSAPRLSLYCKQAEFPSFSSCTFIGVLNSNE